MLALRSEASLPGAPVELTFDEVYEQYFEPLALTLRRVGVPEAQLDDALQETFLVVHRRLSEFEGRSSLKTWLIGIALNVASNQLRSLRRAGPSVEVDPEAVADTSSPHQHVEHSENVRKLYRLLEQLDHPHRTVFVLAELHQLTAPEIAEALAIKLNTVYSRLRVARERFQTALNAEEEKR